MTMDTPAMIAIATILLILVAGGLFVAIRVFGGRIVDRDHPTKPTAPVQTSAKGSGRSDGSEQRPE